LSAEAAQIDPSPPADDPLRLMFCPQCDYCLEGLPLEGTCPECGFNYNQEFVIIRAGPPIARFAVRFGQVGVWIVWGFWMLIWCGFIVLNLRSSRGDPTMFLMFGYLIFMTAWGWLDRLMSPRPQHLLIWIAPDGIGQGTAAAANSPGAKLRAWVSMGMALIIPISVVLLSRGPGTVVVLVTVSLISLFVVIIQRSSRAKIARKATESRPELLSWHSFKKLRLWQYSGEYYRLRAETRGLLTSYPIDAVFRATKEQFAGLRSRIAIWSGKAVDS